MAFQLLNMAFLVQTSPVAKAVLLSLADRADWPNGRCAPSHRDTASRTCLSEKSVTRGIDELENAGHITVDRSNGRHSKYIVHPQPPTVSPRSAALTTDSQSVVLIQTTDSQSVVPLAPAAPATDPQSGDPGLTVHKPQTHSPTNRQEPSLNRQVLQPMPEGPFDPPDWIDRELWDDWLAIRKGLKARNTHRALKAIVADLARWRSAGHDPNTIVEKSLRSSWKDVYEPKSASRAGADPSSEWWRSDAGIERKAREVGVSSQGCRTYWDLKERVIAKMAATTHAGVSA